MLVQDVMQTKLFTVTPETTLPEALRLTGQRGVRHLPVLDGDRLVGILSDRDLKRAMASPATSLEAHELNYLLDRLRVEEIMTRTVITIGRMFPIEDAAALMVREKIGALPVTDDGRLVGLVAETDVLRLFVRALGAGEPSSRLDVDLGDRPHALAEVVQTVEAAGAEISSLVTLTDWGSTKEAVIRVRTINPRPGCLGAPSPRVHRAGSLAGADDAPRNRQGPPLGSLVGVEPRARLPRASTPRARGARGSRAAAVHRQGLLWLPHDRHRRDAHRPGPARRGRPASGRDPGALASRSVCSGTDPTHAEPAVDRHRGQCPCRLPGLAPLSRGPKGGLPRSGFRLVRSRLSGSSI